ncbi:hypothetical protein A3SI_16597 [Nitritalea halalkaliphila LW7]|uniref:Lipoprotein n=1 Tax=Nitritalea halalkaliphila LW7 TaxID=1189621 RepID=I5BWY6_9BACT|nr:hypothetical protein [Nitritalea halalkaliphila]EIM74088.1 hypothetical protein A3SI_16597 [Nitritalea halalkaliphila LW7]
MKNFGIYALMLLLFSCGKPESEATQSFPPALQFLLMDDSDSIYLASLEADALLLRASAPNEASASLYLSEDRSLLFSMERASGQINIMELARFGKWLPQPIERPLPTHWTGVQNHALIFNDGDGSVLYTQADTAVTAGFSLRVLELEESSAHHGAALYLNSGTVAMTVKGEQEEGVLPQRVALVDLRSQQKLLSTEALALGGIHGAQSNGTYALFGTMEGILWIKEDLSYGLIAYPEPLQNSSGNWIGSLKGAGSTFVGSARNLGLFQLDPEAQTIVSLYASDQVADYQVSADGRYTVVLRKDNRLALLDNTSLALLQEMPIPDQPETAKGYKIALSEQLLVVAALGYRQLQFFDISTLQPLGQFSSDVVLRDFLVF